MININQSQYKPVIKTHLKGTVHLDPEKLRMPDNEMFSEAQKIYPSNLRPKTKKKLKTELFNDETK